MSARPEETGGTSRSHQVGAESPSETQRPKGLRRAAMAGAWCALVVLGAHLPAWAADLADFQSPLGWDGRLIQPDGLYAVTVPESWTVTPLDERSFHGSAPGEDSFFLYVTVAKKQFDTLDGLLDTLMELPKQKMKAFKEVSRRSYTQDGHEARTLQAEENDGAWNRIFYMVLFTDTHQYLLRTGCRLDRFPAVQPVMKKILDSFYVGTHQAWKRKNTHAIEDPQGRYSAHVPPGWRVERSSGGMKAEDPSEKGFFSVTVRDRTHGSLQEYGAALAVTLKERYPDHRVGAAMTFPEFSPSNQTAKSVTIVSGGPDGDDSARVYAIALTDRNEFLLEGLITGLEGTERHTEAAGIGSLIGLWHVHLRPE